MQIAINNTVRPLIIPVPLPSRNNVPQHNAVRLMPGSNEVNDETVKALNESATARHWVEKRWLELAAPKKTDGEGLAGFEANAAITFVGECMDLATLESWGDTENRKEVKAAIKKRSKELQKVIDHDTRGVQA